MSLLTILVLWRERSGGRNWLILFLWLWSLNSLSPALGEATSAPSFQYIEIPSLIQNSPEHSHTWLRGYVEVPASWAAADGLLAQSVTLTFENLTDAAEVFVNGVRVGVCGGLPPNYASAREESHRIKVPPGVLRPDQLTTIVLHIYGHDGRWGFAGRAPVLAGYHTECLLAGDWEHWPGVKNWQEIPTPTDSPTRAVFRTFRPATSPLQRPEQLTPGRHLSPEESLARMKASPNLAVDLVLAEPQIAQPVSLDFDQRGRLWVVEYRQYPFPAGVTMVSRDKFYRAIYDRQPEPPPHHARGADRISIHEDQDGDGQFEKHSTFVEGLNIVSSIELDNNGVWVLNPPYLLFYPDRNHDDRPDSDPVVVLSGFGLEDTHSIANSLTRGPDGWLYGVQGSTTSSRIRVEGTDAPEIYREGAMVWRYHPSTRRYEIFGEGGGNAFGLDIDAQGDLFTGHNGDHTRGFHYVPGAYMQKGLGGNKYGPLSNPLALGHLGFMEHDPTPRFSHDVLRYEGLGLPDGYQGQLFAIDPLHQNVVVAEMTARGATFRTRDVGIPLQTDDLAFRPIDIVAGPDGALYVADFCEEFIAHGQHFQGQIDPSTGRVYRLRSADRQRHARLSDCATGHLTTEALLSRLTDADRLRRRLAAEALVDRTNPPLKEPLIEFVERNTPYAALESLWILERQNQLTEDRVLAWLHHDNPMIRRWVVRFVGERVEPAAALSAAVARRAAHEPDVRVRAQLACTARRLPQAECLQIVQHLCLSSNDSDDPYLPLLVWWALESAHQSTAEVLQLYRDPAFWQAPLVATSLARRTMQAYASTDRAGLLACAELLNLAPTAEGRDQLLQGFELAFQGRSMANLPPSLIEALSRFSSNSLTLRVRQGEPAAIREAIDGISAASVDSAQQLDLIRVLGETRVAAAVPIFLKLLSSTQDAELLGTLLAQLSHFDDPAIATTVLQHWRAWPSDTRQEATLLLSSRTAWAEPLVAAVASGQVDAQTVPIDAVVRMSLLTSPVVHDAIGHWWPHALTPQTAEEAASYQRAIHALQTGSGDPYQGFQHFQALCAKCHTLFRTGGNIGPNLTTYQRQDTARLVMHIAQPSLEIREGFEQWTLITQSGQVLNGFLADQDTHIVVLRGTDGQNSSVVRDEIADLQKSSRSLMPTGLLDKLSDQAIRDLMAFLRQSQPLDE